MIAATLLASFGIALAPQTDEAAASPFPGDHVDLALRIEETAFAAQSLSEAPQLLILASEDSGLATAFWLPAGARYIEEFPRGTLRGLALEVLSVADGDWSTSGSIVLGDSLPSLAGGLWFLDCGCALAQSLGGTLTAATPDGSSLPVPLLAVTDEPGPGGDASHGPEFHVPVPTPTDEPEGDKPPKLRPRPLPPV